MKKILTAVLAAILFTGTGAYAEDLAASKALILEAAKETAQEIRANSGGKKPTQEEIGKKLMEKLRARKDDFKKAYESDCVDAYGKDKAQECQCYIEKTDFDEALQQLEQQMLDKDKRDEIKKQMGAKEIENKKACGLESSTSQ